LPATLFRKEVRTTFNGVAAATGKSGAVIGAYLFPLIADNVKNGFSVVMGVCVCCGVLGAILSFVYLEVDIIPPLSSSSGGGDDHLDKIPPGVFVIDDENIEMRPSSLTLSQSNKSNKQPAEVGNRGLDTQNPIIIS